MVNSINRLLNHIAMKGYSKVSCFSAEQGKVLMFHNIGNAEGELNLNVERFEKILAKPRGGV